MFPDVMVTMVLLYSVILSESNDGGKKCGIPHNVLLEDRIVGGYDVGYYKYSWFAVLIRDGEVSCGGALIGPKTILTAAHCYKEVIKAALNNHMKLEEYYIVKMGVYNICKTEKSQKEYIIDKVQIHELFVARDPYFDICLITLKENADFEPICLPKTGNTAGSSQLEEELVELTTNEELKIKFKHGYQEFWLQKLISQLYPALWSIVQQFLIAFPLPYLAERGFSAVATLVTKKRNRLNVIERGFTVVLK